MALNKETKPMIFLVIIYNMADSYLVFSSFYFINSIEIINIPNLWDWIFFFYNCVDQFYQFSNRPIYFDQNINHLVLTLSLAYFSPFLREPFS